MPIPSKIGARPRILRRNPGASSRWIIPDGREGPRRKTPRHVLVSSVITRPSYLASGSTPSHETPRYGTAATGTESGLTPSERAAIIRALNAHPSDFADALPA